MTAEPVSSLLLHAEQDLSCSGIPLKEAIILQLNVVLVCMERRVDDLQEMVAGARAVRLLLAITSLQQMTTGTQAERPDVWAKSV